MPIKVFLLLAALLWVLSAFGAAADPAPLRNEFVVAMHRIRDHQVEPPDSTELQGYILYDYLIAERMRRELAQSPSESLDAAIDAFERTHHGKPVARVLWHEWLANLALRKRWDWFLARSAGLSDANLICDRLTGRLATGDTNGLGAAALARWELAQRAPVNCDGVFTWLKAQGLLTANRVESRARAALAADDWRLARDLTSGLPAARATPLIKGAEILESPHSGLDLLARNSATKVDPEALAIAFERLSNSDYEVAAALLPKLLGRSSVGPELRLRLRRAAALSAAYHRAAGAVDVFRLFPADSSDETVQEWRVRAALWSGDFAQALDWIERMPLTLASQPRWRYWRARALGVTEGNAAAAPIYTDLASLRDYYGYLAADRLNQSYHLNIHASLDDATAQAFLAADPGVSRARELFYCNMEEEAGLEWSVAVGNADSALKVQAAHLAAHWGWYLESIATLAQAGEWDDVPLRYPRPYQAEVAAASKLSGLAEDWIFAVMRQESLFRRDAISRANAHGLMQMLPATAAGVARRWHLPAPKRDDLLDPAKAVPLGAAYLRELLDKSDGRLTLSLAAYNAGPGAVERWRPHKSMDADVWLENIPFNETRAYVQHILEHIVAFAAVRGVPPPRLALLMAPP